LKNENTEEALCQTIRGQVSTGRPLYFLFKLFAKNKDLTPVNLPVSRVIKKIEGEDEK